MEVIRTEQIWLNPEDILSELCHFSKNLWNEANYQVRQEFLSGNRIPHYCDLAGNLKTSENFKSLNAQTAQQILRVLSKSWKAFFKSIKEFSKNPEKFLGKPRIPGYKEKDGEFILIFTNQQFKIEDGYITFPKNLRIDKIKTRLEDDTNIREARIIPKGIIINADVNGSLNIIRKAVPNAFINVHADGIEGVGLHPKRADIKMILSFVDGS